MPAFVRLGKQLNDGAPNPDKEGLPPHPQSGHAGGACTLVASLTFGGKEGFFVNGSEVNGSFFVCFLKKSSGAELRNGSLSLKGSPPNGSRCFER